MYKFAAIQMVSTHDVNHNLERAADLIAQAAERGAVMAILPENFALMGQSEQDKLAVKEEIGSGPLQQFLQAQAKKHEIYLLGGTIPVATAADPKKVKATTLLFNGQGELIAQYSKMHLFDVHIGEKEDKEKYTESDSIEAGNDIVVVDTPFGRIGLSVCYDIRFPELYRAMGEKGMEIIVAPSAFTAVTGRAHWEVLLRARAIENLCYVIAPNQGGQHSNGRETHGHSMIVDPWGKVVACSYQGEAVVIADINLARLQELRQSFPSIEHRKL